jgi:DNA polymerase-3 subunit gamma/tau
MLTKEAFNALLKTLEEPPENVYFILCTTEIHKIPETIISRCQRFDFKRIDTKTIMTRLSYIAQTEKIEAEDAAIELIARHSEGGLRDAIGLMEQLTIGDKLLAEYVRSHLGITGHQTIVALHDLLEKKEMQKAIHLINEVHNEGYDLSSFAKEILEGLRDKLISGIQQGKAADLGILEMISRFEEARDMLRNTVIPQLPLEIAVIKICGGGETMTDGTTAVNKEVKAKPVAAAPKPAAAAPIIPKMPEATPEATNSEKETAQVLKKEFETEQFKEGSVGQHWARVTDKVQPPSLRRSLMEAKVAQVDDATIKLIFRARFHFEKVNTIECRAKAETIITELFGKTIKVVCELDESELKMKAEDRSKMAQEKAKPAERKKAPDANAAGDLADKAMEIFGGDDF